MSVDEFFSALPFVPDPFQEAAARAIESGESVVVTAPTGSGKTLIAEAAVHLALQRGRRAFYTTPLKALSNQKYADFLAAYGEERVGLLTGDNSINGDAPVVVMTTEVLRNMIYSDVGGLDELEVVVLDEVHYLQDRFRGAVWEEVIIHAPRRIQLVCLSATVANPDEFCDWVRKRRGPTTLILEESRPVPLESLYMVRDRYAEDGVLTEPILERRKGLSIPNPSVVRLLGRKGSRRRFTTPRRAEVIDRLAAADLLPAIYFIFSRAGCENAADRLVGNGIRLTTSEERRAIRDHAVARTDHLDPRDLAVLGFDRWVNQLEAGVAAHHAGMVPAFKETVEDLFLRGLVRVVFATETLSLGINMPARTVVLESLSKFTGEAHEVLLPGDYTQLTGRAGRRGIDVRGYGVVLHSRFIDFDRVAALAAAGSHSLRSSFRPTYNMAANLVANYPRNQAERLLNSSFGQFQRRRSTASLRRALQRQEEALAGLEEDFHCDRGDVGEYLELLRSIDKSAHQAAARDFTRSLRPGHVIEIPAGKRSGRYAVVKQWRGADPPRVTLVSAWGKLAQFRSGHLTAGSVRLGRIALPEPHQPRQPEFQRSVAALLRTFEPEEAEPLGHGWASADHPVATCPDRARHIEAARRAERAQREVQRLRNQIEREGEGLVAEFHSILDLLEEWGYVGGWQLTPSGQRLRFIYNELDLLLTEAIGRGLFTDLDPAETAALASCFVYEARGEGLQERLPSDHLVASWQALIALTRNLNTAERHRHLPETRSPDAGFAELSFAWAHGLDLEELLGDDELAAGDFVRTCRQLLDLLRQIRDAAPMLSQQATAAIRMLDRGVVAAGGLT